MLQILGGRTYIDNDRILFARGNDVLYYDAASKTSSVATLTISAGSMQSAGSNYPSLNDMTYAGAETTAMTVRGYRSPVQVSKTARGVQARAIAKGQSELTSKELERLEDVLKSSTVLAEAVPLASQKYIGPK